MNMFEMFSYQHDVVVYSSIAWRKKANILVSGVLVSLK